MVAPDNVLVGRHACTAQTSVLRRCDTYSPDPCIVASCWSQLMRHAVGVVLEEINAPFDTALTVARLDDSDQWSRTDLPTQVKHLCPGSRANWVKA